MQKQTTVLQNIMRKAVIATQYAFVLGLLWLTGIVFTV
jgi:hypothetical protein